MPLLTGVYDPARLEHNRFIITNWAHLKREPDSKPQRVLHAEVAVEE